MIAHVYRPDTACNTDGGYAGCLETGVFRGTGGEAMQDLGYELPRLHILRRWVNKGKKRKGGGLASPTISAQALFLAVHSPTRLALPRGSKPAVTILLGWVCTNVNSLPSGAMK